MSGEHKWIAATSESTCTAFYITAFPNTSAPRCPHSPVNHPVIKVSLICSATNAFASISRRVARTGFLFTPRIISFLARSYLPFCFTRLFLPPNPLYVFTLCFALVLEGERLTDWGGQMTIQVWAGANPSSGFATQGRRWRESKGCRSSSQRCKSQRQTGKTPELSSAD